MANLCHFILYSVPVDENTPDREFIIIKMTKCHFDNYMISLNKEIPSLMTIP